MWILTLLFRENLEIWTEKEQRVRRTRDQTLEIKSILNLIYLGQSKPLKSSPFFCVWWPSVDTWLQQQRRGRAHKVRLIAWRMINGGSEGGKLINAFFLFSQPFAKAVQNVSCIKSMQFSCN